MERRRRRRRRRRRSSSQEENHSPLLSIITSASLLALLYLPRPLLPLLLSPVPISTLLLLTTLLHLSSPTTTPPPPQPEPKPETRNPLPIPPFCQWVPCYGPLEVIYEDYEGEEEEDEHVGSPENSSCKGGNAVGLSGFGLADSNSCSSNCSSWEEEGMIEIALEGEEEEEEEEEEGLIEIDISA